MTTNRSSRVKQIFLEAFELDEKERQAFLDKACEGDADLRSSVDRLLAADRVAKTSDLENPILDAAAHAAGDTGDGVTDPPRVPDRIGPFRIERIIGTGGMGTVYQGVQDNPRRIVAVKVMHERLRSKSARRRFEYESAVLARLRHPAIAQVYAAGTHTEGDHSYPYFAMEYLPNALPITDYCRRSNLGASERLILFEQVCQAVHHGHQKGIIHRDIKPDNVLVDSQGSVRLIDFGVARAIDADIVADTLLTGHGQIIGTLQYMSPEQVESDTSDIDTRADVYALGMLLYELLTGVLPYDVGKVGLAEAMSVIRYQAPPRSKSTTQALLRGDLETITFKALEKDRSRRYQSAEDLRRDIDNYLHMRPIAARPQSFVYQLRVFARRNRGIVASVAALLVFLVAGSIFVTIQYLRAESARLEAVLAREAEEDARRQAEDQRRHAEEERNRAQDERDRATEARAEADRRRTEAVAISDFLAEMLESVAPYRATGEVVTVREILDRVSDRIDQDFGGTPGVRASLHTVIGGTYMSLGEYPKAEHHLRRSLDLQRSIHGDAHPDTHSSRMNLGNLCRLQSRYDIAQVLLEQAVQGLKESVGEADERTIEAMNELANVYADRSRPEEAKQLYEQAVFAARKHLGDEHNVTLATRNNLAELELKHFDIDRAESEFRELLDIRTRVNGDSHPETITALNNLALTQRERGDQDESEALLRRVAEAAERVWGEHHPNTLTSHNNLAMQLATTGQFDEAEKLLRDALDAVEARLGSRNLRSIQTKRNLAYFLMRLRKHDEAETLYMDAYLRQRDVSGIEHPEVLISLNQLHELYSATDRPTQAEPMYLEILDKRRELLGADHVETVAAGFHLANLYRENGRLEDAQKLYAPAVEVWMRERPDSWRTHAMRAAWGASLMELGRYEEAEPMLLETHSELVRRFGEQNRMVEANRWNIIELYRKWEKPEKEKAWRER